MSGDAPTHPPTLYVCRTKDWVWHWCSNCSEHPLQNPSLENNGLQAVMTKPAIGDLCHECIRLTRNKDCAA